MDHDIRIGAAAAALGVSIDTLRRWERRGRIRFERRGTQRYMTPDELARILRERASHEQGTVRNRLPGVVVAVRRHRTLTEIELACGPYRVVSSMEPARAEALALVPGRSATAVIEATTVAIERA